MLQRLLKQEAQKTHELTRKDVSDMATQIHWACGCFIHLANLQKAVAPANYGSLAIGRYVHTLDLSEEDTVSFGIVGYRDVDLPLP